jgi:hypothetical protein
MVTRTLGGFPALSPSDRESDEEKVLAEKLELVDLPNRN